MCLVDHRNDGSSIRSSWLALVADDDVTICGNHLLNGIHGPKGPDGNLGLERYCPEPALARLVLILFASLMTIHGVFQVVSRCMSILRQSRVTDRKFERVIY